MQIQMIVLLIFFQSFVTCQQSPEKILPFPNSIIFQSLDGGENWEDISVGLPEKFQANCIFTNSAEILLGHKDGFYRRSTKSTSPHWAQEALLEGRILDIFPGQLGLYARSAWGGLSQEIPGTGIWRPVYTDLKDKKVLSVLEIQNGALLVGCTDGIFKSGDRGHTWKQVFQDGLVSGLIMADGVIIGGGSKGLLRSTDDGEQWEWVLTENHSSYKTRLINGRFAAITNEVGTWQEAIADPDRMASKIRISSDSGKTWLRIDENLSALRFIVSNNESPVRVIKDIAQVGESIFCSLDTGIFRSTNGGKSWQLVLQSSGKKLFQLAVSGQTIYAVLVFDGC